MACKNTISFLCREFKCRKFHRQDCGSRHLKGSIFIKVEGGSILKGVNCQIFLFKQYTINLVLQINVERQSRSSLYLWCTCLPWTQWISNPIISSSNQVLRPAKEPNINLSCFTRQNSSYMFLSPFSNIVQHFTQVTSIAPFIKITSLMCIKNDPPNFSFRLTLFYINTLFHQKIKIQQTN